MATLHYDTRSDWGWDFAIARPSHHPHFTPALLFVPALDCRLRPIGTLQRSKQQVPKDSRPLPRSDVVRTYETSRCGHRDPESWGATEDDVPAGQQQRGFGLCVWVVVRLLATPAVEGLADCPCSRPPPPAPAPETRAKP
ncbi:hypothetical protein CDEST_03235 [Colletotrichum destructivum]|uniref:Uncharacterized protein n=1 Tax=Colletotrichum destructivum TaxID=34406 RepID=A0AAX4I582_9PEZI|nr:hypothetical protein CDEST_03235 [Colletotrichum destructivum]